MPQACGDTTAFYLEWQKPDTTSHWVLVHQGRGPQEADCRRGISRRRKHDVVSLMRPVVQHRKDVFALQVWIIRQDLLVRSSRREQLEHIRNADAQSTNAGASPALAGFHGDSIQAIQIHRISRNFDVTHYPVQRQGPDFVSSVNFET